MESVPQILERALTDALDKCLGPAHAAAVQARACDDPKFGDYQCSTLLGLARQIKRNPRELAQSVVAALGSSLAEVCQSVEVAGAGYVNFRLSPKFLGHQIPRALADLRLGMPATDSPQTVVLDYSAPNVAKPMHVGHIRSTLLGDALARLLRFVGHRVITDNHLGDWGTQFGYLLVGIKQGGRCESLEDCERIYKEIYAQAENDTALKNQVRAELARLQAGDGENRTLWQRICEISLVEFEKIYTRLGVSFDHTLGESFYHLQLSQVVAELRKRGLARESDGAICVFFDTPDLQDRPMLVQKQDGAFLYSTTDLAALQYRIRRWQPDEILYVTDARQQLHFRQLFTAARNWGIVGNTRLRHIAFGTILGEDGKPLKTREGEPPKLHDLLNEAERRARAIVEEKNPELSARQKEEIARVVGLGALKYADLSQNRTSDYMFSWEKMLAMTGNTAPYLQYAYVRIRSIFRKGETVSASRGLILTDAAELELAKHLLRFPEAISSALEDYRPHLLCAYLYDLATKFGAFYESCPVLKAAEPARFSRLTLCRLTAAVLHRGLQLLGIETIEQM